MDKIIYVLVVVGIVAVGGLVLYGLRAFSNATTSVTVTEVEPGIRCAKAVTGDGVAIDCWEARR